MKKFKFLRQDSSRYRRLRNKWRKPKGSQSKLRKKIKGAGRSPNIGYRTPKKFRGLHPSGRKEFLISNLKELELLEKNTALRISSRVGKKKKKEIVEKARKEGFKILNA